MSTEQQIIKGISVNTDGQASIDPSLNDILFDLAIQFEEPTGFPVDIEHVVAAVILAVRNNDFDVNTQLISSDKHLINVLTPHVKTVFTRYRGCVGDSEV